MSSRHPCVSYVGEQELSTVALRLLADGLTGDQQIGYFGWGEHRDLVDRLAALADANASRAGAVRIVSLDQQFARERPPRPATLMEFWADVTEGAVAAGFSALRAVIDTTPWLSESEGRAMILQGDHLVDRYCLTHPLNVICVCDAGLLDPLAVAEITCIHPVAHGPTSSFHLYATLTADIALSGEIDAFSIPVLERVLAALNPGASKNELVIDATGLRFVNHTALLTLERHAERVAVIDVVIRTSSDSAKRLSELLDLRRVRVEVVEPAA